MQIGTDGVGYVQKLVWWLTNLYLHKLLSPCSSAQFQFVFSTETECLMYALEEKTQQLEYIKPMFDVTALNIFMNRFCVLVDSDSLVCNLTTV